MKKIFHWQLFRYEMIIASSALALFARCLSTISYPTRARGIIKFIKMKGKNMDKLNLITSYN